MNECKCQILSFLASWNFWKSAQRFWILRKHVSCNVKKVSLVCSNIDRFRFASFFTVPVHLFEHWRFNFLLCEKSSFGTVKKVSLVCSNINNFKIQRKSTVPWTSASVRFCHFWPVGIFENLRSVFEFCANTFLVTSKKCRWSAVILIVFVSLRFSLYQCTFLNVDDSISYFMKNQVLEPDMKI